MCHAVYLVPYLLGKLPNSVYARLGHITGREVEDNAVAIFNYAGGAHAVVEASMVMGGAPRFLLEVHGTHGTVMFRSDSSPKGRGATVDSSFVVREGSGGGFVPAELGRPLPSPLSQWVDHIREGKRADENLSASLDLSRLIEAAYLSAGEGRAVALCDLDEGSVQS
jgi:predicted dehydrogenase